MVMEVSVSCGGLILIGVLLCVPLGSALGEGVDASAEELLVLKLKAAGLKVGNNPSRKSLIMLGTAQEKSDRQSDSAGLQGRRARLMHEATLVAKVGIAKFMGQLFSQQERVLDREQPEQKTWLSEAMVSRQIDRNLEGCAVLDFAEKIGDGMCSMAVAVEWSAGSERDFRDVRLNQVELTATDKKSAGDVISRAPWLYMGGRALRMKDGFHFPIGVSIGEIEGVTGAFLARRIAEIDGQAVRAFEDLFQTPLVSRLKSEDAVVRQNSAVNDMVTVREGVQQSISAARSRMIGKEVVFEGRFVHPQTGRACYVVAYGPSIGQYRELDNPASKVRKVEIVPVVNNGRGGGF